MSKKTNSKIFLVLLLGTLSAFGPFITDLYLPALPQMGTFFNTTASMTQLSLTTSVVGLSVGQLFIGPISDKFGRKLPLIISLVLYIISTITIIFAKDINQLIFLRAIQGLASSGSVVISRAIATDLYRGREMTRFFGLLMAVNGIAPVVSPVIGSLLLEITDWRGIFIVLALIGILLLMVCLGLKESLCTDNRLQGSILTSFRPFIHIIKNKVFMTFVGMQSFLVASFFGYLASSAFIFQDFYKITALNYSLIFALNGIAIVIGVNIAAKMATRKALSIGIWGFLAATVFISCILISKENVLLLEIGFFIMMLCFGLVVPGSSSLAMDTERQYAGSASAILGFCPFFLGGIVSPLVGLGNLFYSTSFILVFFSILGVIAYRKVFHLIDN
ncbi:multidrug effflux MFS transporter [Pasteurella bettyae]|uniref:Bcr/CflA family efflux transporter n=1 Tax=Pasteurella bettyae CCUG 2042 TaxID=1095749 RepID=I3DI40_9PAST|nr:multidrug effflux MFS transporter [Pasteurella bettyae]EIJ71383.1 drug resistance transporter, Bcr/CflA family [Pasteurella bettyae CCUG 2042]SUB21546.1 bicyclomycin resistance protein-2 [Pasteurella bettyae]